MSTYEITDVTPDARPHIVSSHATMASAVKRAERRLSRGADWLAIFVRDDDGYSAPVPEWVGRTTGPC